jgi:NADH-quinone oxidoreductase subunit N
MLLLETFAAKFTQKVAGAAAFMIFVIALFLELCAPKSLSPFINAWIHFDQAAYLFTTLFLLIGMASTLISEAFFVRFQASKGEYYFLLISAVFGLVLIGASADFLTLFLGMETLSMALYVLTGYMKKWKASHESAIKYFLLGSLGAAFLLYGIALIYGATGTTHFNALRTSAPTQTLFLAGSALVAVGLCFKAAVVPFHAWAPDVYEGAPNPVTAFMAVGTKAGAFAAFSRVFLEAMPYSDLKMSLSLAALAIITLLYGSFLALCQTGLRRFFAYSGIAHAGFLLIPIIAVGPSSLEAITFYLAIYAMATLGAFAAIAHLDTQSSGVTIKDLTGLFKRSPLMAAILALCLLTLAGIPPTAGFFAKFYLFKLAYEQGYTLLVLVGLLSTILSVYYYLRMVSVMLAEPAESGMALKGLWPAAACALVLGLALVFFSIYPASLMAR